MNIAISMIISMFVHLMNPHAAALNTQTNIQTDVTPTETPSITPTTTVTPTEMPTGTITPTEMPSVTPSASPTPQPTGIWNGIHWVPANIRAFFGLSNAASRHERNEERFEAKHGVKPTHGVEPTEESNNE